MSFFNDVINNGIQAFNNSSLESYRLLITQYQLPALALHLSAWQPGIIQVPFCYEIPQLELFFSFEYPHDLTPTSFFPIQKQLHDFSTPFTDCEHNIRRLLSLNFTSSTWGDWTGVWSSDTWSSRRYSTTTLLFATI
jgi:hypothetical protein